MSESPHGVLDAQMKEPDTHDVSSSIHKENQSEISDAISRDEISEEPMVLAVSNEQEGNGLGQSTVAAPDEKLVEVKEDPAVYDSINSSAHQEDTSDGAVDESESLEPERKKLKTENIPKSVEQEPQATSTEADVKTDSNQENPTAGSHSDLSFSKEISPIQREIESHSMTKQKEETEKSFETAVVNELTIANSEFTPSKLPTDVNQIPDASSEDISVIEPTSKPINIVQQASPNPPHIISPNNINTSSTIPIIPNRPTPSSTTLPIINNNIISSSGIVSGPARTSNQTFPVYTQPSAPPTPKTRLILLYDKPRYYHMIMQLSELRSIPHESVTIVELFEVSKLISERKKYDFLNICIEYNDEFEGNLKKYNEFIEKNPSIFQEDFQEISYHIHFAPEKKWKLDYTDAEKEQYYEFVKTLKKYVSDKITHCSIINKYDMDTVYITERNELAKLGQEIQQDIENWKYLRILDYGESSIRFLPGVKFPDSLEILNIGGGYALETLTGFKTPNKLKTLLASQGAIQSIDSISFSLNLERLELADNKIYFLNQVEFPQTLLHLDLSQNRIESLRGVDFPRNLISLNLGFNPIESIKGVKFPDTLKYLDISNIPNESMTGVKFPDSLIVLNLQASMTNTRGLKLPPTLNKVILCDNGVNSINPLKLPNSIEVLYLNNNNIKTLNKVQFPTSLKELYLGDNLITTLKNVQFPPSLEVLDIEMDPDYDEHEKHITTLKDVFFPPNLKVLKLGYHSIKSIESYEFPFSLVSLSLAYNELKTIRNVRLGNNLKTLDLSGNPELTNIDQLIIPESVSELRIPPELIPFLPNYIIERANKKQLILKKSQ